jgi:hypothetical protein
MSAIHRSTTLDVHRRRWPTRCLGVLVALAATVAVALAGAGAAGATGHSGTGAFT